MSHWIAAAERAEAETAQTALNAIRYGGHVRLMLRYSEGIDPATGKHDAGTLEIPLSPDSLASVERTVEAMLRHRRKALADALRAEADKIDPPPPADTP